MAETLYQINSLSRYYQRGTHTVKAVDQINLTVNDGEFLAVVGSSGSGKSTLLNLMAGLDTPTEGDIKFDQISLASMNRRTLAGYRAEKVGMVFQSFNLISHHDALRNVELALYFDHTPHQFRKDKAAAMLDKLGLGDRLDHKPSDLSGGEQQRVALARALVKEPKVLFADEPTGNLDLENTHQITKLLSDLNHDGLTIIMVTHDLDMARSSADRIIKMDYGKVVDETSNPKRDA